MLGATDLDFARSVLVSLLTDSHCLRANWYRCSTAAPSLNHITRPRNDRGPARPFDYGLLPHDYDFFPTVTRTMGRTSSGSLRALESSAFRIPPTVLVSNPRARAWSRMF